MILTVTSNPSIDRTLHIPRLEPGGVVRATHATAEAGGKGINVSRALTTHGHPTTAIVLMSEASQGGFRSLLGGGTPLETVTVVGDVRVNVSLVEPDGTVTKVNEPGPQLTEKDAAALLEWVAARSPTATWVVGTGSLPPGLGADFYARLARRLVGQARLAVDADGEALHACLGERVALIKPNLRELEVLVGRPLPTLGDVVGAAEDVVRVGPDLAVLVSLGPDGALLVDRHAVVHAEARVEDVANTVGAGDALLAGFLAAGGGTDALRTAVAWSVAACRSPGTQMRRVSAEDEAVVLVHPNARPERQLAA